MLQITADNFSLTYDLATDTGELRYGITKQLTALIEHGIWIPQNAAAWFEFEYSNDRFTKGHRPRAPILEVELTRIRVLAGLSDDRIARSVALWELQKWDKLMRHGPWKCRDPYCKLGCAKITQLFDSLRALFTSRLSKLANDNEW